MSFHFNEKGNLIPGIHTCTWLEFAEVFETNPIRSHIISGLHKLISVMRNYGKPIIYVGGSLVTLKALPGDFDVCWNYENITDEIVEALFADYPCFDELDPPRTAQKTIFFGEFFYAELPLGLTGHTFLEFFQKDRDNNPKGIVLLKLNDFL